MTRRWSRALILAVAAATLAGCGDGSPSILDGKGTESSRIGSLWWLMFGLAAAVYVLVAGLVLVAITRRSNGSTEDASRRRDDRFIWGGGLALPVVVLSLLGVVTVTTTKDLRQSDAQEVHLAVDANRWWWGVEYLDDGFRTANEIRVPVGRTIDVALHSNNVVHSFWVPQLAGKVDVIPGQTNHLRFTARAAGTYRGQCAEFCGLQHAHMAFVVVAMEPQDYDRWIARRTSGAGIIPTDELAAQGQRVFAQESCGGCHTVAGTTADGTVGPDLTNFGERSSIGALTIANTRENLAQWIADSQRFKPGNLMPPISLTPDQLRQLVAYLEGLE